LKVKDTDMTTTNDTKIKTGLVLEGGALRGLYTMGIVDVLIENNLQKNQFRESFIACTEK